MSDEIQVIRRAEIPAIHEVERDGAKAFVGELRDFRRSDALAAFMPCASGLSIGWVRLAPGEIVREHLHPVPSVMIFDGGFGELFGDSRRDLAAGDVIVVPPGQRGFSAGPEGLSALSVRFVEAPAGEGDPPRAPSPSRDLADLLAYNQERLAAFLRAPVFELLTDGTLEDPVKRESYLRHLQIWVNGNQTLLLTRQASCVDPEVERVFFRHMQEELGHDMLHAAREGEEQRRPEPPPRDPFMEAITDWFTYQMHVLDNAEKAAIIHLVIENASSAYHERAKPLLARYVSLEYFDVHVENDADHAALGEQLLRDASPRTCARLRRIIGEAWDMLGAMGDRLVDVTRAAGGQS